MRAVKKTMEVKMLTSKTEEEQNAQDIELGNGITIEGGILLLFLGLLIIGVIGYFALRDLGIDSISSHVGGVGIIGLLGGLTGIIAKKKGYDYWKAFLLGFVLPIVLGVIAVLLVQPMSCGGSVSLGVALLIVIISSFAKRRDVDKLTGSQKA
jgi:hypothetical protein